MGPMDGGMQSTSDLVTALRRFQSSCDDYWNALDAYNERGDEEMDFTPVRNLKSDLIDAAEDARTAAELIRIDYVRDVPVSVPFDPYGPTVPVAEPLVTSNLFRLAYFLPATTPIASTISDIPARGDRENLRRPCLEAAQ